MKETPGPGKRRHPRIECDYRGELEISDTTRAGTCAPVTIRAVSLSGLGLAFDEWEGCELDPGTSVLIRFPLGAVTVELPGRVAWIQPRPMERFDLGIELDLDDAPRYTRRAYHAFVSRSHCWTRPAARARAR